MNPHISGTQKAPTRASKSSCHSAYASNNVLTMLKGINSSKYLRLFIRFLILLFNTIFSLKIETITCNKLSHCLFDFDCPDFSQYENEKYDHQVFKFHSLFSNQNEHKMLSMHNLSFYRDQMKINYDENSLDKTNYDKQQKDGHIVLPFPAQDENNKSKFLFKVIYKPESG